MAQSKAASAGGNRGWAAILETGLRLFVNEPEWPLAQAFIGWMNKQPAGCAKALQQLWFTPAPTNTKDFMRSFPPTKFPTPMIRLAVVAMLGTVQNARLIREIQAPIHNPSRADTNGGQPGTAGRAVSRVGTQSPKANLKQAVPGGPEGLSSQPAEHRLQHQQLGDENRTAAPNQAPALSQLGTSTAAKNSPRAESIRPADAHPVKGLARLIAVETLVANVFQVITDGSAVEIERERREAALVKRYVDWLAAHEVIAMRHEIQLPDQTRPLYTDLFDPSRSELLEAKASSERIDVRMALGQLLDYSRYVNHQALAILTPEPVTVDLLDLLSRYNIANVHERSDGMFSRQS